MSYQDFAPSRGTETNVTPEIDVPIIAMATTYHFEDLFARKNSSFPEPLRLVRYDINISTPKYTTMTIKIYADFMWFIYDY